IVSSLRDLLMTARLGDGSSKGSWPQGRRGKHARNFTGRGKQDYRRHLRLRRETSGLCLGRHRARRRRAGKGIPETGWRVADAVRDRLRQGLRGARAQSLVAAGAAEGEGEAGVHAVAVRTLGRTTLP